LSLRPTELLIFGNAKGGTPLLQAVQTIGTGRRTCDGESGNCVTVTVQQLPFRL
jgi:hypothetical protein